MIDPASDGYDPRPFARARAAPLSEAAGDKVTVPMTEREDEQQAYADYLDAFHKRELHREIEMLENAAFEEAYSAGMHGLSDTTARRALRETTNRLLTQIESNLRSQVESGMTGRFNPETHVVVPLHGISEAMEVIAHAPQGLGEHDPRVRVYNILRGWLSPSPETPDHKL